MSLSKSKCWYSYSCLQFLKHAVPLRGSPKAAPLVQAPVLTSNKLLRSLYFAT